MAAHLHSHRTPAVASSSPRSPELEPLASPDRGEESARSSGTATRTAHARPNSRRLDKTRELRDPTFRKKHPESTPVRRAKPRLRNCATQDERDLASSTAPARL